jgi:hypothetical protein
MSLPSLDRLIDWMTVQPVVGLLMAITALVLFGSALARAGDPSGAFWPWARRLLEASAGALLFLGLLWGFRAILNNNISTFNATHGSLSDASLQSAQSIWGRPHVQRELQVAHFIEKTVQEEIPREDPTLPPIYRDVQVREQVPQNSLLGFTGVVTLTLSEREKGYALYNGYLIDARFNYQTVNDSDLETDAVYAFPLSPGQTLYENFTILVDGQDISPQLRFSQDLVSWTRRMQPQQHSTVAVSYSSRGMESFYYQIPVQREIRGGLLVVTIDRLPVSLLNYPEGVLTPSEVQPTADGAGSILTWRLDRAITVAGMGVALLQPEQPGAQVLRVLRNGPYALTLLGAMLALTLVILGRPLNFLELGLLAGAYCVEFLIMAAISDYFLGFWGSLIAGALLTGLLTVLLFHRRTTRGLRALIYGLVAFFTLVYPLAGLLDQVTQRNAFDALVQVALILYLFGVVLYRQTRPAAPAAGPAAEPALAPAD